MNYNFKRLVISRLFAENILLLLLQMMSMKFSVLSSTPLPIDFAAGNAAAFVFMRGYTILPGVWLGGVFAMLLSGWSLADSLLLASAYTMQTAILFFLCLRYISPGLLFLKKRLVLRFALLCLILSLVFSPVLLSWQADLAGLIIVTLAITHWDMYFPELNRWSQIPSFIAIATFFIIALVIDLIYSLGFYNQLNNIGLYISLLTIMIIISGIRRVNME